MITEEYNQKENWYHNGMSVSKIVKSVTTENKKGMKKICCNNIIAIKLVFMSFEAILINKHGL